MKTKISFPFLSALTVVLCLMPAGRATAQAFANLHNFTAINTFTNNDGAEPMGNLIVSGNTLYGTASVAGPDSGGIVFAVKTDGTGFTNVHTFTHDTFFNYPNGATPQGGLILSNNTLYGTTEGGGASGWGTVFRVNTDGSGFTNLHSFANGAGGALPRGGLVLAGNTLYGTTENGNSQNKGILFAVNTDGTGFTNLHGFSATSANANLVETNSDGASPNRTLMVLGNMLYGTTQYGGTNGYGVIFAINTNGTGFTNLHTFAAVNQASLTNSDGRNPFAGLMLFSNRLYGTTRDGGSFGFGTVYALNTNGTDFTTVHHFSGADGNSWTSGLVASSNTLYGTTFGTTTNNSIDSGAMFALNTNGTGFKILYHFTLLSNASTNRDGSEPWGTLILSSNVLYGTTRHGGTSGEGTLFSLNVTAAPPPIQFTASPTNGTVSLNVQFNSPGVDANGNTITNWHWDFGDSSTSTAQNPSHTYTTAGNFSPTLVATNIYGDAVSSVGPSITVSPVPTVQFTANPTNGAAPLVVQFNSPGTDSGGNTIVSWRWNFGDSSTSSAQNPSHTYTNNGDFSPTLVVTNNLGNMISASGPSITVTSAPPAGHTLVAYYTFDDGNLAATDFSGNGNNLGYPFDYNGGSANIAEDGLTPPDSVLFDDNGGAGGSYYYNSSSNLLTPLSGSFSISLWLKTTQVSGSDTDDGVSGNAGIVFTYEQFVVPMALTGHKLAFLTASEFTDVLHSTTSIDTGDYVHVVVTRDEATGQKNIYVNGALDASDVGETGILPDPVEMEIGSGNGTGFNGELDDIQIYSGVLSSSEVSQLYNNPGTTIPDGTGGGGGPDLATALNATNLTWTAGGAGADWFGETNITHDGVSAAQSGLIIDSQTNWIQTTVPADGQVSFYWKVSSEEFFDFLTFYINGVQQDAISGEVDWTQDTFPVSAGDTLRWEYGKDDDNNSEGSDAGWVDQVLYTPPASPVSVTFDLQIQRYEDSVFGFTDYEAFPNLLFVDPVPVTTNVVVSPDGVMFSEVWAGDVTSDNQNGEGFSSLDDLIYACTNGQWTLTINKGDPGEKVFRFNVSISGVDTNLLSPITVLVPANGAVNVPTNSPFQWRGPTNFPDVFVEAYQTDPTFAFDGYTFLSGDATNWPSPPALLVGTNYFFVQYEFFSVTNITFTMPVADDQTPLSSWTTEGDLFSDVLTSFVVAVPVPSPALLTPSKGGGNLQLSFQTHAGHSETIQARTNLVLGSWVAVTNFTGDGSVRQFSFPATNFPGKFFRVMTQ